MQSCTSKFSLFFVRQLGLGKKIIKQIRKRVKQIQQDPKTVAIRYNETRTAIVKGFPYMIHYLVVEQSKQIVISAVFHTSQNPKKWRK